MKAIRKKMMHSFFKIFCYIYVLLMGLVCACFTEKSEDNKQGWVLSFQQVGLKDPRELGL